MSAWEYVTHDPDVDLARLRHKPNGGNPSLLWQLHSYGVTEKALSKGSQLI